MDTRPPFRLDDAYDADRASDGTSRYGVYIRQRLDMFDDLDDPGRFTVDPVQFAAVAWDIATGPIMAPPYVRTGNPRILSATCCRNNWDGSLLADITLAVHRPTELRRILGFADWDLDSFRDAYLEPSEQALANRPAMLTTTRLLLPIPTGRLHAPKDTPATVSTPDAKDSVRAVAAVLNEQLTPILHALG